MRHSKYSVYVLKLVQKKIKTSWNTSWLVISLKLPTLSLHVENLWDWVVLESQKIYKRLKDLLFKGFFKWKIFNHELLK